MLYTSSQGCTTITNFASSVSHGMYLELNLGLCQYRQGKGEC